MSKNLIVMSLVGTFLTVGCTSIDVARNSYEPKEPFPQQKSQDWCFDNYSSAAATSKQRGQNAKFCDSQAQRQYNEYSRKVKGNNDPERQEASR